MDKKPELITESVETEVIENTETNALKTRRKKAKPTAKKQFDFIDDKHEKEVQDIPINNLIKEQTVRRGSDFKDPLDYRTSTQSNMSSASTYARKMGGMGLPGMGMGNPLIPKGMTFTKPSEAKKQ